LKRSIHFLIFDSLNRSEQSSLFSVPSFFSQDCDSLHLYNKSFKVLIVLKEDYKIRFSKNEIGFENN